MKDDLQAGRFADSDTGSGPASGQRSGQELERRFPVALALYAVLALVVWFTMDGGKVMVMGRPVELRLVPLVVIGGLAVKTVLALQADRIRRSGEKDSY